MNTTLFVGSLPYTASEEDLKAHFEQAGNVVSAKIIMDRMTNRSKGFGFVEMASAEEAQAAIDAFNEQDFMERKIYVNEARPREEQQ